MRSLILLLVGLFYVQSAFAANAYEAANEAVAVKEMQRRATKKEKPEQQKQSATSVEPRKLISEDSLKALNKWLDTEKEYKRLKNLMAKQNSRIRLFKERLDKAEKVAELYNQPGKDPEYLRDQKEAQANLGEAKKNHDVEAKKLDDLKSELAVAEKRYTIAEKAYKIYNPTLIGFAGKSVDENKVTDESELESEEVAPEDDASSEDAAPAE
ncbi:hypothetical protein Ctha_0197 [Chloroherpeton thalassium ATCC 35110]|uniref:Outer membrane chaperone Skp (OmpH) n=1 Tax=Chloroherpeton thalassium (strain ATCC 35110 / GB-78) TaxID=517418 RepID=B3QT25_CHLT3|nr:hypothetical protein [Chloroherpeton thalassium]ACF12668.1 hypothetical protein Ctha_0197 [Chloroherpeton thalassium ATCC 35110]